MAKQTISVIKGDGIGPSIIDAAIEILDAVGCEFDYEYIDAGLAALEKLVNFYHQKRSKPFPVIKSR